MTTTERRETEQRADLQGQPPPAAAIPPGPLRDRLQVAEERHTGTDGEGRVRGRSTNTPKVVSVHWRSFPPLWRSGTQSPARAHAGGRVWSKNVQHGEGVGRAPVPAMGTRVEPLGATPRL